MMLTGFKGVKYGLQKPARPVPSKPGAKLAAFSRGGSSDDDEDNVSVQLRRQQAHKAKQAKVKDTLLPSQHVHGVNGGSDLGVLTSARF